MTTPTTLTSGPMTPEQLAERDSCVQIIHKGFKTFKEVGESIIAISDKRLYRDTHSTFEQFCDEVLKITSRHAYRLVAQTKAVKEVENATRVSQTLTGREAHELSKADEGTRAEVLKKVQSTGPVTAKKIAAAVTESKQVDPNEALASKAKDVFKGLELPESEPNQGVTAAKGLAILMEEWLPKLNLDEAPHLKLQLQVSIKAMDKHLAKLKQQQLKAD